MGADRPCDERRPCRKRAGPKRAANLARRVRDVAALVDQGGAIAGEWDALLLRGCQGRSTRGFRPRQA